MVTYRAHMVLITMCSVYLKSKVACEALQKLWTWWMMHCKDGYSTFPLGLPNCTCLHALYILNKEQTATRPALSGNNIHYSGKYFLRSEKEIPPSIKCGKENALIDFFICQWGNKIKPATKIPLLIENVFKSTYFYLQHYYFSRNKHSLKVFKGNTLQK